MKKTFVLLCGALIIAGLAWGQTGVKKKRALPHEFGNVILNNYSDRAGIAPVQFEHWLHRSLFTCRLCHVDLAFAMKTGGSNIKAADNEKGFYCGSCHNGRTTVNGKKVFASCALPYPQESTRICERCHSVGRQVKPEYDFYVYTAKLPKERFGNGVNWEKAAADGILKPIDAVEGISIKRAPMKVQKDFTLNATVAGMADIIFSHKKHTIWSGCEGCHPEIFVGIKTGMTKYSMADIYAGKYCGVCHINVAFPLIDCQRCHTKPV